MDRESPIGVLAFAAEQAVFDGQAFTFLSCVGQLLGHALLPAGRPRSAEADLPQRVAQLESDLLSDVTTALLSSPDRIDKVERAVTVLGLRLGCCCVVDLDDEDGRRRIAFAPSPNRLPCDTLDRLRSATFERTLAHGPWSSAGDPRLQHACAELGSDWCIATPLHACDEHVGVLLLWGSADTVSFSLPLAERVARPIATAIVNSRMYRDATKAIEHRDRLLATVSHDLKNPLGLILMTVDRVLTEAPAPDRRRGLEAIRRSAVRMSALVQDLLDAGAIESGALSMHPQATDMRALVEETVETFAARASGARTELVVDIGPDLPAAFADGPRVLQVLANIVGNAVKFTSAGVIRIAAARKESAIAVSVSDTGCGVAKPELEHVFERFWCGPSASCGSGLGLWICKSIIEQSGGTIAIESEPGTGTTVTFTLPISQPTP